MDKAQIAYDMRNVRFWWYVFPITTFLLRRTKAKLGLTWTREPGFRGEIPDPRRG